MARAAHGDSKEPYWRQVLARWRSSGLSVRAYCETQGISLQSFYRWRRELQRRDRARPQFLPVRVVAEPVASDGDGGAIEVVLTNGRCLRVRPGFDRATLVRLLDVLGDGGTSCRACLPRCASGSVSGRPI
jgi:transposase